MNRTSGIYEQRHGSCWDNEQKRIRILGEHHVMWRTLWASTPYMTSQVDNSRGPDKKRVPWWYAVLTLFNFLLKAFNQLGKNPNKIFSRTLLMSVINTVPKRKKFELYYLKNSVVKQCLKIVMFLWASVDVFMVDI